MVLLKTPTLEQNYTLQGYMLLLKHYEFTCDLFLNSRAGTWNIFLKYTVTTPSIQLIDWVKGEKKLLEKEEH